MKALSIGCSENVNSLYVRPWHSDFFSNPLVSVFCYILVLKSISIFDEINYGLGEKLHFYINAVAGCLVTKAMDNAMKIKHNRDYNKKLGNI